MLLLSQPAELLVITSSGKHVSPVHLEGSDETRLVNSVA